MRWWCGSLLFCLAVSCEDTRPIVSEPGGDAGALESGATSCEPGETRCHGQLAFQSCTPDGKWGESQTCGGYSDDGTSSYCAWVTSGTQRWAACVEPACWWWLSSGLPAGEHAGVCLPGGSFRACEASGVLAPAEPCAGECREVGQINGAHLGYCLAECTDGERECLAGPLYRECQGGAWSEPRACDAGQPCQPVAEGALLDIRCGGACSPGTSRCSADRSSVEPCSVDQVPCLRGQCVQSGAQAQCQLECEPGSLSCAFDGDLVERACTDEGRWLVPSACPEGQRCRVGSSDVSNAPGEGRCVECAPGESHCVENAVSTCSSDHTFAERVACTGSATCIEVRVAERTLAYCE